MTSLTLGPAPVERARLGRRAQLLAPASVTYNMVEAAIAITGGTLAGSVALVGLGLDSIGEVCSGLVVLWQFCSPLPESRERRALRLIALSYFALAAYVTVDAVRKLRSPCRSWSARPWATSPCARPPRCSPSPCWR